LSPNLRLGFISENPTRNNPSRLGDKHTRKNIPIMQLF
jgi:hypothetical protein